MDNDKSENKRLIDQMTLEEKAGLCSGAGFWHTKAIQMLGVGRMMVSDGPHGLRKQADESDHLGINESIKAVCFPAGCALAASFDRDLAREMGEALGDECQAENVGVILGPAVNIKRSPLCGRNFEYYSEDPLLGGEIASSFIEGVQSRNVGTSIKHYLANSQEHRRMSSDSIIDERTLRELYLAVFEKPVKQARPWTVMCSYNRINGVYASESSRFLTDILRNEWGFDGFVVSDWGAVNDRTAGLRAGLDLEMPGTYGINDQLIVDAVRSGRLSESVLDQAVERIINIVMKWHKGRQAAVWDKAEHHELSAKIAAESAVLLKNDGILPLSQETKVAIIGEFAAKPRFQGGGSSHINSFMTTSMLDAMTGNDYIYAQGYHAEQDSADHRLEEEALAAAAGAQAAIIFAGLPDSYESEGYDRSHMRLPANQNQLIAKIAEIQPNLVIVLHNGSPVEMPWVGQVKGVLEMYLGGQAVGKAAKQILYGQVNPSGHLAETFPLKLEDNPSWLFYGGEGDRVEYREGVFVGYRYYDSKHQPVLFPFGHGLSYTSFEITDMQIGAVDISDQDSVSVGITVKNTGDRFGKTVIQLYVADQQRRIIRPAKELKAFEKIGLAPGEEKSFSVVLDKRAFAYYDTDLAQWHVQSGVFKLMAGFSVEDIRISKELTVHAEVEKKKVYTANSLFGDLLDNPRTTRIVEPLASCFTHIMQNSEESSSAHAAITAEMQRAMLKYMPLRAVIQLGNGTASYQLLDEVITELNQL